MKRSSGILVNILFGVVFCVILTGCVKSKITVKVNPDGTGNILVSRIFTKEIVIMIAGQREQMQEQMGDMGGVEVPEDPFYNEKQLRMAAGQFGPGVELVKSMKYDKSGSKGYIALYKFADINEIFINLQTVVMEDNNMMFSMGGMGDDDDEIEVADKEDDAFEFKLEGDVEKTLTVVVPSYPDPEIDDEDELDSEGDEDAFGGPGGEDGMEEMMAMGNPFGFTGSETQSEASLRTMRGFAQTVSIEVNSKNQKSNATHKLKTSKGGVRYVLLSMDMDKVVASPRGRKAMNPETMAGMGGGADSPASFYGNMKGLAGLNIQTNDLVVKFK